MNECRECRDRMIEALYGELAPADRDRFERHREACPDCAAEMAALAGTLAADGQARKARPGSGILAGLLGPPLAPDALGGHRRGPAPVARRPDRPPLSPSAPLVLPGGRRGGPAARRHLRRQPADRPSRASGGDDRGRHRRRGPVRGRRPGGGVHREVQGPAPRPGQLRPVRRGRLRPRHGPQENDVARPGRRSPGASPRPRGRRREKAARSRRPTSRSS